MKSIILALAVIASQIAAADSCRTDGCVDRKSKQMDAVLSYMHNNDDCLNAVSYLLSLKRVGSDDVRAVCGDGKDRQAFLYKTTLQADGTYSVSVKETKAPKSVASKSCNTKAIAGTKAVGKINGVNLLDIKVTGEVMTEGDGTRLIISARDLHDHPYAFAADVGQSEGPCVLFGVTMTASP